MKIKKLFSHRVTSLLLVFLLAFSMLPTGALAAEVAEEPHIHTEECTHEEVISSEIETTPVDETTEIPIEPQIEDQVAPTSGSIGDSAVMWAFDTESGRLSISGSGDCNVFSSADDQPWAAFRTQITEVWFMDMESVSISNLAYWFEGCTALTMAEIPYTTPIIGTRAFADCPNLAVLMFYYYDTDNFTIAPGAFYSPSTTETSLRVVTEQQNAVLKIATYDWETDNRTVHMSDAYGLVTLTGCALSDCSCSSCDWYYSYDYMNASKHNTWVRCTNCSAAFLLSQDAHSYSSNGYCSDCGHYNSSYDTSVCYHYSSYYSWSGCTYYEYCSNCGEYLGSGVSHGSTYTEWSGCNWYEYCRDCDQLMDSGTSHGTYSYGSWQYYSSTRHRRSATCNDCGETSYSYGSHSKTTKYTNYSDTQHQYGSYCSTCSSYVGSTSYGNHSYSYGSWNNYSSTQHRRTKSCTLCDYSTYEYASHSLSYGSWTSIGDSQHSRTISCSCGYSTTEYAEHSLTYGDWEINEGADYSNTHKRTVSCSCGYSKTEYEAHSCYGVSDWEYVDATYHKRSEECECGYPRTLYSYHSYSTEKESITNSEHSVVKTCSDCGHSTTSTEAHNFSYGSWQISSDTQHERTATCECGYSGVEYGDHYDSDSDGYCDECGYLTTFFSVTVPANMSLTVANDGYVYSATNAAVVNNSSHAVEITSVMITAGNGWTIVPYDYNMADEKVDAKLIGFYLNGAETTQTGTNETLALPDNWTIDRDDSFDLDYDAVISATSEAIQNEQVLTLVFVINWAPR